MNELTISDLVADETLHEPVEDAAWASIQTPFAVDELMAFLADIERLYRINPMLEFKNFISLGKNCFAMRGRNISQSPAFDFDLEMTIKRRDDGFQVQYNKGIKSSTEFRVESSDSGSVLTITDRYDRLPDKEREARLAEVDKSLLIWARDLQRFMLMWQRWSGFRPWRWYMSRIWQPMKPAARRITYMLLWISLIEVSLILLGAGIYFSEYT